MMEDKKKIKRKFQNFMKALRLMKITKLNGQDVIARSPSAELRINSATEQSRQDCFAALAMTGYCVVRLFI